MGGQSGTVSSGQTIVVHTFDGKVTQEYTSPEPGRVLLLHTSGGLFGLPQDRCRPREAVPVLIPLPLLRSLHKKKKKGAPRFKIPHGFFESLPLFIINCVIKNFIFNYVLIDITCFIGL